MKKCFKVGLRKFFALFISAVMVLSVLSFAGCGGSGSQADGSAEHPYELLNVSYDPTRELYEAYNKLFEEHYLQETGKNVHVTNSHGGSGGQANSVIEGSNKADVVTLALANDISKIEKDGMIEPGWLDEFDHQSSPYTSTIVFLVRKGNPKEIHDWDDLVKDGVEVITPDPSTSGGAMWNFLASWYYAEKKYDGDQEKIVDFCTKLYKNVKVMDSGARTSTLTFTDNKQGDVLIAWENEAIATITENSTDYQLITPSISILAQPSVAIVDENAKKNGTEEIAADYLKYLYSEEAQEIIAQSGYRPTDKKIQKKYKDKFAKVEMINIDHFGGWAKAYDTYFAEGTIFDKIMETVNSEK